MQEKFAFCIQKQHFLPLFQYFFTSKCDRSIVNSLSSRYRSVIGPLSRHKAFDMQEVSANLAVLRGWHGN